jgi:hypothetical protein
MSGQLLRFIPFLLLAGIFQFGGSVMGQSNDQASSSEEVNQLLSRLKKTSGNMDSVRDRLRRLEARVLGKPEPPPYVPEEKVPLPVPSESSKPASLPRQSVPKQAVASKDFIENGLPQVAQIRGNVSVYDSGSTSYRSLKVGFSISEPTLFMVSEGGELVVSFPGKIAAMLGSGTRAVISPERNGQYEVDLRNGTVTALLDPNRDKVNGPRFSIRTKTGVTEATGTFYAVTEFNGQAFAATKKGAVQKKTIPPSKPSLAAYMKKFKAAKEQGKSSRKE